jgi:hypothetical protein
MRPRSCGVDELLREKVGFGEWCRAELETATRYCVYILTATWTKNKNSTKQLKIMGWTITVLCKNQ